jgi:hypothetical protein
MPEREDRNRNEGDEPPQEQPQPPPQEQPQPPPEQPQPPPPEQPPPAAPPAQPPAAPQPGAGGLFGRDQIASIVGNWMTSSNPYGHQDANYWIDKIMGATGGATQANIDYFKGRFLENPNSNPHTGGGGGWTTNQGLLNSPLMAPWTTPFSYSPFSSVAYHPMDPWNPSVHYQPPTEADMLKDPSYQFRLKEGQKALERFASGRGTLGTGGTNVDLTKYGQDYASQEWQNMYQRNLTDYQTQYQSELNDYLTRYNANLQDFQTLYGTDLNNWMTNYNKALNEYQMQYNIFEQNQAKQYNRLSGMAGMGLNAASGLSGYGAGYGANAANTVLGGANAQAGYYTDAASARAAGNVGSANAMMGWLGPWLQYLIQQYTTTGKPPQIPA